ncbi:uncharacterized protein LOC142353175 [Convolutriloba macropyga]|uniref:uncharacterized protein LOC142353175 n=1 Tax=Convolutriloba macropyga TaxID=536237 RepID=UPI003F524D10
MPNEQSGSAKGKTETNSQEGCPNSPAADKKDKKNYKQKTNDAKGFFQKVGDRFSHMGDKMKNNDSLKVFKDDHVIKLVNRKVEGALRVTDSGEIDCKGQKDVKDDKYLQFVVKNHGSNIVSLRSLTYAWEEKDKFLRVKEDGRLCCDGDGKSNDSKFRLHTNKQKYITLENYKYMYHHIAAASDGSLFSPKNATEKNEASQFTPELLGIHTQTSYGWKVQQI